MITSCMAAWQQQLAACLHATVILVCSEHCPLLPGQYYLCICASFTCTESYRAWEQEQAEAAQVTPGVSVPC